MREGTLSGARNLKKGEILFRENDPSEAMYVIKSGKIAITKSKGTSDIVLAELTIGDMLGEMAFFDSKPRSAGARAVIDTVVIELPFKSLNAQFKTFPEWLKAIVRTVNNHLRNANKKIKELEKAVDEEKLFFTPHMMTRLMGILTLVAHRFGEKTEHGFEIPPNTLRRYTIQVFQQPTAKMTKLTEILQGMGYMKIEDLGESRQRLTIDKLDVLFGFVEYYNDFLFKDESKRTQIEEKELRPMNALLFYGRKATPDVKTGKLKLNLTEMQFNSHRDLGYIFSHDDVNSLIEKKLTSDKIPEDGGILTIYPDLKEIERIYPYWDIVYALKRVPGRE